MMKSNVQRSGFGLLAMLFLLLLSSATAWGEHHEKKDEKSSAAHEKETTEARLSRLAHELSDLLDRGVETFETAEPQETALQQRQRDAAKGGLVRARNAARALVEDLDGGGTRDSSSTYFMEVDGFMRDALETAGDFEPSSQGAQILARIEALLRQLGRIYDEG